MGRKLPAMTCKPGCSACCGPVPFDAQERAALVAAHPVKRFDWIEWHGRYFLKEAMETLSCPLLTADGKCGAYEQRPRICRAFGLVDDHHLRCPMGCGPDKLLSAKDGERYIMGTSA